MHATTLLRGRGGRRRSEDNPNAEGMVRYFEGGGEEGGVLRYETKDATWPDRALLCSAADPKVMVWSEGYVLLCCGDGCRFKRLVPK